MKQTKYRAYDNDNKKMTKVVAMDWGANDTIVTCHLQYSDGHIEKHYPNREGYGDDITFLEYINYKDLNEVEIYESDIIHYHRHEGWYAESIPVYKLGVIAWNDSALGFRIQPIDTHSGKVNYGVDGEKIRTSHRIVKVGNLYESDIWELIRKFKNGELK